MRTTVDIPDSLLREIKIRAANEGTTVRALVLEGVALRLQKDQTNARPQKGPRFPVIRSRKPGSLKLGKEGVYEYIPFP